MRHILFRLVSGSIVSSGASHWQDQDRGQGLNHCILDALNLVDAIGNWQAKQGTKVELIAAYDEDMIQRGAEEVRLSVKSALMVHDWASFMESPLMKHGVTKVSWFLESDRN